MVRAMTALHGFISNYVAVYERRGGGCEVDAVSATPAFVFVLLAVSVVAEGNVSKFGVYLAHLLLLSLGLILSIVFLLVGRIRFLLVGHGASYSW